MQIAIVLSVGTVQVMEMYRAQVISRARRAAQHALTW